MLGIVFTTLIDMLEEKVSPDFADEVITAAELDNDGAFTAVGNYPFSEMEKLIAVLVEKTGQPVETLLHDFGFYLFGKLAAAHGHVMQGKTDLLGLLDRLDDDIHVQVRKLYPDSDLPAFTVLSRTDNAMRLRYHSLRDLYPLAEGLMDAAAEYFGNAITREVRKCGEPHTYEFSITVIA